MIYSEEKIVSYWCKRNVVLAWYCFFQVENLGKHSEDDNLAYLYN